MRNDADSAGIRVRVTTAGESCADDMVVLAVTGEIDAYTGTHLREHVLAGVGPDRGGVVLDLAQVTLMSAAGLRALADTAATLADTGRRLLIARCRPVVREVVRQIGPPLAVVDHRSVDAALDAYRAEHIEPTEEEGLPLLRWRARNLPGPLRSRPLIAGAVTELHRRYDLPDSEIAFTLLRRSSQRYNLRIRALALAFLSAPAVPPERPMWFTGRRRDLPPPITFTSPSRGWPSSRSGFLATVLDSALSIMDTGAGYVQLADRFLGGLRLESQRGLPREFNLSFCYVDKPDNASTTALRSGREATRNLDEEPDPTPRTLLGAEGLRSVHSVPLVDAEHPAAGVVSTLHPQRAPRTSRNQAAALDVVATESAAWLAWHQRTIVLDALEHLHKAARSARRH